MIRLRIFLVDTVMSYGNGYHFQLRLCFTVTVIFLVLHAFSQMPLFNVTIQVDDELIIQQTFASVTS